MSHVKNPSKQNYGPKSAEEREDNRSQEVELPIPEKKNDTITTGNDTQAETTRVKAGKITEEETKSGNGKEKNFQTGFDVNNGNGDRNEKRGNEKERLERDKTTDPKTKDADWQQDKMNEANNQQGNKQDVDKTNRGNDTRKDSIIDRPKTETYENTKDENAGDKLKRENYTHTSEEEKRDEKNRKNKEKAVR